VKLLLDTHALLWTLFEEWRLGDSVRQLLSDTNNDVVASVASSWEVAIKQGLGKLPYPGDLRQAINDSGFEYLAITPDHCHAYSHLPHDGKHRDPFDRMLVVQAMEENAHLLSRDPALDRYGVQRIW
jgi:PIN domain nuclease of toxin-antitoxin system